MPINFKCTSCGNTLRVKDEFAGKKAKCPKCSNVCPIPAETQSSDLFGSQTDNDSDLFGAMPPSKPVSTPNPYSASASMGVAPAGRSADPREAFRPLRDAAFFLKWAGWFYIIFGVLYCLTIVGILFAWIFIWGGICAKEGARKIEEGYAANNHHQLYEGAKNLGTLFKIVGILTMIASAIIALYAVFIIFALFLGIGAAAF